MSPGEIGDACKMLVAAELTLAGIPALKVPNNCVGYDVIAHRPGHSELQRISVKPCMLRQGPADIGNCLTDSFDWLALVILPGESETQRRMFLIPRDVAVEKARRNNPTLKSPNEGGWSVGEAANIFTLFENNFLLLHEDELGHPTVKGFEAWKRRNGLRMSPDW